MVTHADILKRSQQIKKRKRIGLFVICGVIVAAVITGLIFFLRWNYFLISKVSIRGNNIIQSNDILAEVSEELDGNYFFIIPKKSVFLYPAGAIEKGLFAHWPRIKRVSFQFDKHNEIAVTVEERRAQVVWCDKEENSHCYFADEEGYIFSEAPQYSDNLFYSIYGGLPESPLGKEPIVKDHFQNLALFARSLPAALKGSDLEKSWLCRINIISDEDNEAFLDGSRDRWRILFNNDPATTTLQNLNSVLTSDSLKKDLLVSKTAIDYFDLRYGKKVFYKFK